MKYLPLILLELCSMGLFSQNIKTNPAYYNWFDSIIDISNTNLLNGITFKEKYKTLDGNNQYFLEYDFILGNLVYDGQPYFDVQMKYDLSGDDLIIKLSTSKSGQFAIQLIKDHVIEFQIDHHLFINSNSLNSDLSALDKKGFLEVIYQSKTISVYKKHIKNSEQRRNDRFAYTKFISKTMYYIDYGNTFHVLRSKKDMIQIFPDLKKNITDFYSKNRPLLKYNYNAFLRKLMEHLNESNKLNYI